MRKFYRRIRVDETTMRFCAVCAVCGKTEHHSKLPLLCRRKELLPELEQGQGHGIAQSAYLRARMRSSRELAKRFNYCQSCGKWVCDECFHIEGDVDCCIECAAKTTAR